MKVNVPYEIHTGKTVNVEIDLSEELITDILVLWLSARIVQSCLQTGVLVVVGSSDGEELGEAAKIAVYNAQRMHDMVRDDSAISNAMLPILSMMGADAFLENIKSAIEAFRDGDNNPCHCQICSAVRSIIETGDVPLTVGQVLKRLVASEPDLSDKMSTDLDWVRLGEILVNNDLSNSERDQALLGQLAEVASSIDMGLLQHKSKE